VVLGINQYILIQQLHSHDALSFNPINTLMSRKGSLNEATPSPLAMVLETDTSAACHYGATQADQHDKTDLSVDCRFKRSRFQDSLKLSNPSEHRSGLRSQLRPVDEDVYKPVDREDSKPVNDLSRLPRQMPCAAGASS
jgi:hypothetical protein